MLYSWSPVDGNAATGRFHPHDRRITAYAGRRRRIDTWSSSARRTGCRMSRGRSYSYSSVLDLPRGWRSCRLSHIGFHLEQQPPPEARGVPSREDSQPSRCNLRKRELGFNRLAHGRPDQGCHQQSLPRDYFEHLLRGCPYFVDSAAAQLRNEELQIGRGMLLLRCTDWSTATNKHRWIRSETNSRSFDTGRHMNSSQYPRLMSRRHTAGDLHRPRSDDEKGS